MNDFARENQKHVTSIALELEALRGDFDALQEYFSDALDIEYRVDARREYRSVCVMITGSGPSIYIDTEKRAVLLYWGNDEATAYLDCATVEAIDELFCEYYNC